MSDTIHNAIVMFICKVVDEVFSYTWHQVFTVFGYRLTQILDLRARRGVQLLKMGLTRGFIRGDYTKCCMISVPSALIYCELTRHSCFIYFLL